MARVLVTFATRKRLTSFVGRPDCLRRQAHPAQPSTPCIRLSRPWRSFTTSRMERVGKCAEDERSESKGSRADCAAIERTSKAKWPQCPAPSGSPTSNARSFAKQSHKRVRRLQQDRVAGRGGKADPLAGGSPPRARPARLRGIHGRPRRRRRSGHEHGSTAMHSYDYNDTFAVSSASYLFAAAAFRAIS